MNHDHEAITDYALHLWRDWMSDNFSELRALWYPRESKGISSGWVVSEDAFQDLADECESRIVQCVQGVVAGMPPAMRGALEHSLGLCAVLRIRNYEQSLQEARGRVYRAVVGNGVV